jgi:murein DD-endopeptidase MepM/ murein hydrolase activator NlpD
MLAWFVSEVVNGGRTGPAAEWGARFVAALFFGAVALLLVTRRKRRFLEYLRLGVLGLLGIAFVAALGLLYFLTGPRDMSLYPPREGSPYRLPWKPGIARLCSQSNRAVVSHRGGEEFAFDFAMPVGTEICAARGGVVVDVVDKNDGNGLTKPWNAVIILHDDGTRGVYGHIRQGGSRVKVNQVVQQGDVICEAGNVGYSTSPHLHFHVSKKNRTTPIAFADVPGDGVPRAMRRYRSGD